MGSKYDRYREKPPEDRLAGWAVLLLAALIVLVLLSFRKDLANLFAELGR